MNKKFSKISLLAVIQAVMLLVALILSVISSNKAYALNNINTVIALCVLAIILDVAMVLLGDKLHGVLADVVFFVTVVCNAYSLCEMIQGRTKLMGYVYFSDLESSNPIAISAMNLAIVAWVFYLVALVVNIVIGFLKHEND
jgi:glucan phosphoethanolaminetransferase (alkaline phosphatase superfamily)